MTRRETLRAAQAAARAGDETRARALFASVGISYVVVRKAVAL